MSPLRLLLRTTASENAGQHRAAQRPIADGLLPFTRRHRGALGRGLLFSTFLVGARLALPVPLQQVVDHGNASPAGVATTGQVTLMSAAFVGLALCAGVAEHFQRMAFAAFAGRTISDARGAALAGMPENRDQQTVDTMARVLGDCMRVKQGLKGVLNHITVSGMLMIGVCVAIAVTDRTAGVIVASGSAVLVLVGVAGARQVGRVAARHRQREVTLAGTVHRLVVEQGAADNQQSIAALRELDGESGEADIDLTRWEGVTTWAATVVLALTAAAALLVSIHAAQNGVISSGALFGVMAYLLVLQGPAIRSVRQITRTAPLLVSARELGGVLLHPAA